MEKKLSSYAKMKIKHAAEMAALRKDIDTLLNGSFVDKLGVEMKYKMAAGLEKTGWFGNSSFNRP